MRNGDYTYRGRRPRVGVLADTGIQLVYFVLMIIWLEVIYQLFTFHAIKPIFGYVVLFSLGIGALFTVLTGFFRQKINRVIAMTINIVMILFYMTELVYHSIFKMPLFIDAAKTGAGDAMAYWKEALEAIAKNIPAFLLMLVPLIIYRIILNRKVVIKKRGFSLQLLMVALMVALFALPIGVIQLSGKNSIIYSVYYGFDDVNLAAQDVGMITTVRLGAQKQMFGEGESVADNLVLDQSDKKSETDKTTTSKKVSNSKKDSRVIQTTQNQGKNVMDIDFSSLITNEKDSDIKLMHEYFNEQQGTNKNQYTGKFKGYNLIFLTAEAFSPYCVDKDITPTLYKLVNNGFVFKNFYTALWQTSTSDGEYTAMNGLLPIGSHSFRRSSKNYVPFTMGNQFNRLGIQSMAYHDNSLSYYDRNLTHPNMGYLFKAANLGKVTEKNGKDLIFKMAHPQSWPQSDLEMMQATMGEYDKNTPFHAYYMTVSGHMNYSFDGNAMAAKNKDAVKNMKVSDEAKAYVACNVELDKALEYMINELKAQGVLDKTVICLSADHYPYGLSEGKVDELAGKKVDKDFEIYRNNLIIWNSAMTEPIVINKPASSLDILPTLSNLFGFTYDSRLLSGSDILSDSDPLVILSNKSFITDKVKYNAKTKQVTYLVDKSQVPEGYVDKKIKEVRNKFVIAQGIVDHDYYGHIKKYLKFPTSK